MSTAEEPTSPAPLPAAPNVYLRITKPLEDHHKYSCFWYKLDLKRQKPVSMNWQSEYLYGSAAVAVKSEIYLLGGVRFVPEYCSSYPDEPLYYHEIEADEVYRIDTTTNNVNLFESAPSMLKPRTVSHDCAVLGDRIIFFNNRWWKNNVPHIMEIFKQSSDHWFGLSKPKVGLCRELKRSLSDRPLTSDSQNNRVLVHFEGKGLYAFYPDSLKWECLRRKQHKFFELSVVVGNVFYYCFRYDDEVRGHGLYGLGALDVTNGFKPLKIVWPCGFDHQYQFSRDLRWVALIDLGNGKLCLLAEFHKCINNVSDDYYYSSGDEDEDEDEDELCAKPEKKKYVLGVRCFVLESEKQPPPPQPDNGRLRRKTRLLVKTASRFDFEFDELVSSSSLDFQVRNAMAV